MHYQLYDGEEEFEPRVIPKPVTKHVSCFFNLFDDIIKRLSCSSRVIIYYKNDYGQFAVLRSASCARGIFDF